jgi:VCBS repeat protein
MRFSSAANQAIVVGDLDGDGFPDIIASGNQVQELATLSLFRNRADGTFENERMIPVAFGAKIEDAADLNGDGHADLLVSNYWANGIAVYPGLGELQFDNNGVAYGTATHGGPSRILDYDRDGVPDVVSFSFGSGNPVRVHLFHGGDNRKTTFETTLANADAPSIRIIGGVPEILAAEHLGQIEIFRVANGQVTVSTRPAGPGVDRTSVFADVNGDGIDDIIDLTDTDSLTEPLFVTLARADGSFEDRKQVSQPRHIAFPIAIHAADLDGDGDTDLVVSDFRSSALQFFRGDGTGSFAEAAAIDAGGPVNDFKIADVNGDGRPDILTVNEDHSISVVINPAPCRKRAVK